MSQLADFIDRCGRLLELERQAEIDETHRLLANLSAAELQRRGRCLIDLRLGETRFGLGGRIHIDLTPASSPHLPAHRIQVGDVVAIQPMRGGKRDASDAPTGVVAKVRRESVVIALDRDLESDLNGALRIDKVANDVTYRRLREALTALGSAKVGVANRLRRVCFGEAEPRVLDADPITPFDPQLNPSQHEAVAFALEAPDVALIHGPPGTGKTTAVVELIRQAVAAGERVLACAASNVAVDHLAEKLCDTEVTIVRVGHPARLNPAVVGNSLDALVERSESQALVRELQNDLDRKLKRMRRAGNYHDRQSLRQEVRYLRQGIREAEQRIVRDILKGADVILATNTGAGARHFDGLEFDRVVIDEAAQSLEAACWIPLLKGPRAVLAGDHLQLPPTIRSIEAERGGLGVTLFGRLAERFPATAHLLDVQYRMNETIMRWSSDALYGGKIHAHESVATHRLPGLPGVAETEDTAPVAIFIDTAGFDASEMTDEAQESRWNDGEGRLVDIHVHRLLDAGVPARDIAVITPYSAQVDRLRRRFADIRRLEVDTVDGFQGREKEAVVISLVRSNDRREVGFLADRRRMNVAITRARRQVTVIGDSATVSANPFLEKLLAYLTEHGQYRSAWEYEGLD